MEQREIGDGRGGTKGGTRFVSGGRAELGQGRVGPGLWGAAGGGWWVKLLSWKGRGSEGRSGIKAWIYPEQRGANRVVVLSGRIVAVCLCVGERERESEGKGEARKMDESEPV